jgi:hypothetical protein
MLVQSASEKVGASVTTGDMSSAVAGLDFAVSYDGPALRDGRMQVRELAPPLLALADLFREAKAITHPGQPDVSLEIRATSRGSFSVHLVLTRTVVPAVAVLAADPMNALTNLQSLLLGPWGLFDVVKRIRNRPYRTETVNTAGDTQLDFENGDRFTVPSAVLTMHRTVSVRRTAREVVQPLERDGIDSVAFIRDWATETRIEVGRADLPAFVVDDVPAVEPIIPEQTAEFLLEIVGLTWKQENKWRFSDGSQTFSAAIEDQDFWDKVHARSENFAEGDTLRCVLRIRQTRDEYRRLNTERTVIRVLAHVKPQDPPPLFDGD